MFAYVIRRFLISIVVLFFATILVFLLVSTAGDPLALLRANPHTPHSTIVAREHLLHLNDPLWQRYWIWFTGAIHGNLGNTTNGQPVAPQLWSHLFVTLRMVIVATIIAILVAIGLGVWAAVRQNKLADHTITVTNFVLLATPVFVLGLALKEFVAIPINQHVGSTIFYTDGEQSPTLSGSFFSRLPDYAGHTALPALTLILVSYSVVGHLPALVDDRDARRRPRAPGPGQGLEPAPGAGPPRAAQRADPRHHRHRAGLRRRARRRHPHRVSSSAGRASGRGTSPGVTTLDVNIMLAYLLVTATFVILFNLLADILYGVLDPRIRYA